MYPLLKNKSLTVAMFLCFQSLVLLMVLAAECRGADLQARSLEEVDHPLAHYQDLFRKDEEEQALELRQGKIW